MILRAETSSPIDEEMSKIETGDATHSFDGHEPGDIISASSLSIAVLPDEFGR